MRKVLFTLFLIICIFLFPVNIYASGYDSWTKGSGDEGSTYGISGSLNDNTSSVSDEDIKEEKETKASYFEKQLSKPILNNFIVWAGALGALKITPDSVILGRIAKGEVTSRFSFDLSDGNIYGTLGAIAYSVLRNFTFGILGIVFIYQLFKCLLLSSSKGMADLKNTLYSFIFVFFLLYAVPVIVDYLILFRDAVLKLILQKAVSFSDTSSLNIVGIFYKEAKESLKLSYVVLALLALTGAVWLAFNYTKIAIEQAYLFGVFPIVAIRSFSDKAILNKWGSRFLSNICVPLLDILGYTFLSYMISGKDLTESSNALVAVIFFFCMIPCRNGIMQLFGAPVPGRGLSAVPMLLMASRMFRSNVNSQNSVKEHTNSEFSSGRGKNETIGGSINNKTDINNSTFNTSGSNNASYKEAVIKKNGDISADETNILSKTGSDGGLKTGDLFNETGMYLNSFKDGAYLTEGVSINNDALSSLKSDDIYVFNRPDEHIVNEGTKIKTESGNKEGSNLTYLNKAENENKNETLSRPLVKDETREVKGEIKENIHLENTALNKNDALTGDLISKEDSLKERISREKEVLNKESGLKSAQSDISMPYKREINTGEVIGNSIGIGLLGTGVLTTAISGDKKTIYEDALTPAVLGKEIGEVINKKGEVPKLLQNTEKERVNTIKDQKIEK